MFDGLFKSDKESAVDSKTYDKFENQLIQCVILFRSIKTKSPFIDRRRRIRNKVNHYDGYLLHNLSSISKHCTGLSESSFDDSSAKLISPMSLAANRLHSATFSSFMAVKPLAIPNSIELLNQTTLLSRYTYSLNNMDTSISPSYSPDDCARTFTFLVALKSKRKQ